MRRDCRDGLFEKNSINMGIVRKLTQYFLQNIAVKNVYKKQIIKITKTIKTTKTIKIIKR